LNRKLTGLTPLGLSLVLLYAISLWREGMFERILKEIDVALENDLYYVALFAALTLPDICGALESEDGEASKDSYIKWFDKYVKPYSGSHFNGFECYSFRCSMLHQGRVQHPQRFRYKKILFLDPVRFKAVHDIVVDRVLYIDIFVLTYAMTKAAREWYEKVRDTPRFKVNYSRFVGYRKWTMPDEIGMENCLVIG
jgi:hypothetical protein